MLTREETIKRLAAVSTELQQLQQALAQSWPQALPPADATQIFLNKCQGWEDDRTPEEIVAEIYATRTASDGRPRLNDCAP